MNAAISGRLGIAWLVDGDQCWSYSVDEADWVARRPDDSRLLFAGATDLQYLDRLARDEIVGRLQLQVDCVDAFDCVLYILDGNLSNEVRQEAAATLNDLLAKPHVLDDIEDIFFSQPLPPSADYEGALHAVHTLPGERAHALFVRLGEMQPWIRLCVDGWERIDSELFAPDEQVKTQAILLKAGIYREIVLKLVEGVSLAGPSIRAIQLLQTSKIKNYRAIVTSWIGSLPQQQDQESQVSVEGDLESEDLEEATPIKNARTLQVILSNCSIFRRGELHRMFFFLISDLRYLRRLIGGLADELLLKEREPEKPEKQQLLINLLEHLKVISEHVAQAPYMSSRDEFCEEAYPALDRIEDLPLHVDQWLSRLYEAQKNPKADWLRIFVDSGSAFNDAATDLDEDVTTCRELAGKIRQDSYPSPNLKESETYQTN